MKKKHETMSTRNGVKELNLHRETLRLLQEGTGLMHVVGGTDRTSAGITAGRTCCWAY